MQLVVAPDGEIRLVYAETLDLSRLGLTTISRGSHVEPNALGNWLADLKPVDGPRIGPFAKRSEALEAEVAWLQEHWLVRAQRQSDGQIPNEFLLNVVRSPHGAGAFFVALFPLTERKAMTQAELNRAVARATRESIRRIARRGFVLLTPVPVEREPRVVDWDRLDANRSWSFVEQHNNKRVS